ncbi:MAG TPA: cell division protein SepF [Mycobacteriales bacterium]|jgi:cell division inhibitor SepF|nr:cell division protein SepF [Mycobacteriales bacterium]
MPGAMRKLGLYLGLVEDDEERYDAHGYGPDDYDDEPEPSARGRQRADAHDPVLVRRGEDGRTRGSVALDTAPRPVHVSPHEEPYRITTLHPRTYNEARTIGEHFRDGTPVIMNLTEMDDTDAKRLVDFAAGLSFGLRGRIERVTNKVFLLSPEHVEVTAEDKARIAEGGFFNQS